MTANAAQDEMPIETHLSPGRQLRERRLARNIEVDRIAAQLHLPRDIIEGLEQDRYDGISAPVYVVGYLKNYARLLGMAPEPILDAYRAFAGEPEPQNQKVAPTPSAGRRKRSGMPATTVLALVALGVSVASGLLWWQTRSTTADDQAVTESAAAPEQQAEAADTLGEPTRQTTPADFSAPSTSEGTAQLTATGVATDPPTTAVPPATQPSAIGGTPPTLPPIPAPTESAITPPAETTGAQSEVVLQFSGTSWVDVRGADGNIVIHGEMREGDRQVLKGQPPYKFVIGNAAATQITVRGQPFDVAGRSRGNVARFTLDPAAAQ